jgi:hypothetical protein
VLFTKHATRLRALRRWIRAFHAPRRHRAQDLRMRDGLCLATCSVMRKALVLALLAAIIGLMLAGYLTYREVVSGNGNPTCAPLDEPGALLGAPPCVYGFAIYLVIGSLIAIALLSRRLRS